MADPARQAGARCSRSARRRRQRSVRAIGTFTSDSGRLVDPARRRRSTADLDLEFMHDGHPGVANRSRPATSARRDLSDPDLAGRNRLQARRCSACCRTSTSASKEWIIPPIRPRGAGGQRRQAAVSASVRTARRMPRSWPPSSARRGAWCSPNGLNPRYSQASTPRLDGRVRARRGHAQHRWPTGGDPEFTAILDNYCWGNCRKEEQCLGALVHASYALRDLATGLPHAVRVRQGLACNNEFRAYSARWRPQDHPHPRLHPRVGDVRHRRCRTAR